jgi:hypothetical protein
MQKQRMQVMSVFDTETTNIIDGSNSKAFAVLYIFNDLRYVDISKYDTNSSDIRLYRTLDDTTKYLNNLIEYGLGVNIVPIVCAYNLMFDLQTLKHYFAENYDIKVVAQTATSVYTYDIMRGDRILLRFWDTYYLEMGGLKAMGETCGLPKAVGDWDYTKIRTPRTTLTSEECYYAGRDTEVIPQYLRYILQSNTFVKESDLGSTVLTKTSLIRRMAKTQIGNIKLRTDDGKRRSIGAMFRSMCNENFPASYDVYALHKACFRGGLTFTAARMASVVVDNVASLDVTSMHHAFINGRKTPVNFKVANPMLLQSVCDDIIDTSIKYLLKHYDNPFRNCIHAKIRFTNLKPKYNSVFERSGIMLLSRSKFGKHTAKMTDYGSDERAIMADNEFRSNDYKDTAFKAVFAFGKLVSCESCEIFVNEIELWNIAQVYDFDDMEVCFGDMSVNSVLPPDYVSLQSNVLFERKTAVKNLIKHYKDGVSLNDLPDSIPESIRNEAASGTLDSSFINSYYTSTVKGQFNGIYGTQAQDVLKPEYAVDHMGELYVDDKTKLTRENYNERKPETCNVLYTYGMRIVGGSRMHLLVAMILLYERFGNKVRLTGGDTDSIKMSTDIDVTDSQIMDALKPLHYAIEAAIDKTQKRIRTNYPKLASDLNGIGKFEIERCGKGTRYAKHIELWNKTRVSLDSDNKVHITAAGMPRPVDAYNIEDALNYLTNKYGFEKAVDAIGYNVFVDNSISHCLERTYPDADSIIDMDINDYNGVQSHVMAPEAIALYPTGRWLGESDKESNRDNIEYINRTYNRRVEVDARVLSYNGRTTELRGLIDNDRIL